MVKTLAKLSARWSRGAVVVGLVAVAGCCAHSRPYPKASDEGPPTGGLHTFKVLLDDRGCPVDVEMEQAKRNCANQDRRCVKVDRNRNAKVAFVADGKADFIVYFDPFLQADLTSEGGRLEREIPADAPTKAYSFNLTGKPRGKCRVIDPVIIVW